MAATPLIAPPRRAAVGWTTVWLLGAHAGVVLLGWWCGWQWAVAGLVGLGAGVVCCTLFPHCRLFGSALRRVPCTSRSVILTIDDGPGEDSEEILRLLARHDARAVFFLIGNRAEQHPEAVRRLLAAGHLVGNHTQTHPCYWYWCYPPWRQRREMRQCQQVLTAITGRAPALFRAPAGHRNPYCNPVAAAFGLAVIGWQARGFDGVRTPVEKSLASLRRGLCPGAIVLLHQGQPQSLELLRQVLELLAAEGWQTMLPEAWLNPP